MSNWRWIFILEGMVTIIIGMVAFFLVPCFPQDATWLSPKERDCVFARTRTDEDHLSTVTFRDVVHFFKDIKPFLGGIMYFGECLATKNTILVGLTLLTAAVVPIYCKTTSPNTTVYLPML